jgi:predicted nucleic-acid-binding protein
VRSIDTNALVRFLVADDPDQTAKATNYVAEGVFISHGVLMEAEWVLRRTYGWDRARINVALTHFTRLQPVEPELRPFLLWALDRHRNGADGADMLHLIAARHYPPFKTFDQQLSRQAGSEAPVTVEAA